MNKRNLRLLQTLAVATTLTAGSASLGENANNPFGVATEELPMTHVLVDAARAFEKVDVDKDGLITEDEYAGQRVVYAQLARFNGVIPVDGQTTVRIPVPESLKMPLTVSERAAIDAVARRDYHLHAAGKPGLDQSAWQNARLELFMLADANADDALSGDELGTYARYMAGELSAGLPKS
ncbi:hypothetical protein HK107_11160 [Parvularcula sp. ZS-1/3]|uniref:EF-hand domain-containing protein n=1 Tax=Parvularcula mediterranea TaxID=2732508 RepID=A0A7Y3RML2_9PROT|nr:hypothetical protein [Parvularcula mediterranea]NNU16876.1 hypothetical protein [Parvularcula mediterranea]